MERKGPISMLGIGYSIMYSWDSAQRKSKQLIRLSMYRKKRRTDEQTLGCHVRVEIDGSVW